MEPETVVRTVGVVLQLAGVASIAIGIHDTRAKFTDRPGVLGTARRWLRRVLRQVMWWRKGERVASGRAASISVSGMGSARGSITQNLDGLSVEEALRELERRIKDTNERIGEVRSDLRAQISEVRKALQDERSERDRQLRELEGLVQELAATPLRLEAIGAAMIMVGIALAAWPSAPVQAWRWADTVVSGFGG